MATEVEGNSTSLHLAAGSLTITELGHLASTRVGPKLKLISARSCEASPSMWLTSSPGGQLFSKVCVWGRCTVGDRGGDQQQQQQHLGDVLSQTPSGGGPAGFDKLCR